MFFLVFSVVESESDDAEGVMPELEPISPTKTTGNFYLLFCDQ
jgi:hypothetical protein